MLRVRPKAINREQTDYECDSPDTMNIRMDLDIKINIFLKGRFEGMYSKLEKTQWIV